MTIAEWIFETMDRLGKAGVDSPRRDALVLLEDVLGEDRAWVLAHPERELAVKGSTFHKLNKNVERRVEREPLAYIRGKAWFYGRFFEVSPSVMIPRPESEAFIALLKDLNPAHVIDVGTGSGCLAITAKLEIPETEVVGVDISPKALKIAQENAKIHKVDIEFIKSDLLSSLISIIHPQTSIIANLPYVPEGMVTSPEIAMEPALALFSGKDGLDDYRKFWKQVEALSQKPTAILTESLKSQHKELESLATKVGYKLKKTDVLVQLFQQSTDG